MKKIINLTRDDERAFYGSKNVSFNNIKISGPADGESAYKECNHIEVNNSFIDLRYTFWHLKNSAINDTELTDKCRAPLWYDTKILLNRIKCNGVKAVRECNFVEINDSFFASEEFGWKCKNVVMKNSEVISPYIFFGSKNIELRNFKLTGKYSFQYVKNLHIFMSNLDTKDAFWHAENVIVEDSVVKGEYLAWYAKDIVFINCKISGTQPICYSKNIKFINCTFDESCDLCFENSSVKGDILGNIKSIKNPLSLDIVLEGNPEMIIDEFSRAKKPLIIKKK